MFSEREGVACTWPADSNFHLDVPVAASIACSAPLTEATYKIPSRSTGADRTALPARYCQAAFSGKCNLIGPWPPVRALSPSKVGQLLRDAGVAVCVISIRLG